MIPYIVFSLFMWNYFAVTILETGNIISIFTDFSLFSYSGASPYEPRHEERGKKWPLLSTRFAINQKRILNLSIRPDFSHFL